MNDYQFSDKSREMNVYDLIEMLEERGFRFGFEMPETDIGREGIATRIYYHPEQMMLARVTVPEDKNSPLAKASWDSDTVYSQRETRPLDILGMYFSSGGIDDPRTNQGTVGFYVEKDIQEDLLKWYDAVTQSTKPLPEIIPDYTQLGRIVNMVIDDHQERFCDDCPSIDSDQQVLYYKSVKDIAAFYNMSQIQDEGLKKMLAPVMEAMPARVEQAIFEVLNGDTYRSHERNEAALSWVMEQLGIDKDWFKQRGVDVDLALQPPKNATLELTVSGPAPKDLKERHQLLLRASLRFREATGFHVFGAQYQFEGDRITVQIRNDLNRMDDRKAAEIMQTILQGEGLDAKVRKPPLQAQIAAAEAKRQAQKEDHTQQRTPSRRDQGRS